MLIFNHLGLSTPSTVALIIVVLVVVQYLHVFIVGTTAMAAAMLPVLIGIATAAGLAGWDDYRRLSFADVLQYYSRRAGLRHWQDRHQ